MNPARAAMLAEGITRADIVRAADTYVDFAAGEFEDFGLCFAFRHKPDSVGHFDAYVSVPRILQAVGAPSNVDIKTFYFFPLTRDGFRQRLVMLAFLLTWMDDDAL